MQRRGGRTISRGMLAPINQKENKQDGGSIFEVEGLNAGVDRVHALEESINQKLNGDGRWTDTSPLSPAESVRRLSSLDREESDYLGALMGWSHPHYKGVDWNKVNTADLTQAAAGNFSLEYLQAIYPATVGQENQP